MIEIIVVILLCSTNSKNAKARGKSGGAAVAYTLGMWFGGEILGAVIGIAASGGDGGPAIYIAALLFAAGGGIGSYFIAKRGTVVGQSPAQGYIPPAQQNMGYPAQPGQQLQPGQQQPYAGQPVQQPYTGQQMQSGQQQPYAGQQVQQQPYTGQQGQPLPPSGQQPVYSNQQLQPQQVQQQAAVAQQQTQATQAQQQTQEAHVQAQAAQVQQQAQPTQQPQQQGETSTIVFSAKKVMGQFLVSSVTIEVNGVPYQADFKQPITILAPAGNVQIECYLNYMGKSGIAQQFVTLAPSQTYKLEYKSPAVVTGSGTLNFV